MSAKSRRSTTPSGSRCRQRASARLALCTTIAVLGCAVATVGCKSGSSFSKPSWWTLNGITGASKTDDAALASAPPFSSDIKKPSDSAKQYPTTSTPSGYVITGSASSAASAAPQMQAATPQSPVVYGTAPPAATTPATNGFTATGPSAPPSITPQTGPYASLAGDTIPPPGQPLPPISPTPMPSPGSQAPAAFGAGSAAGGAAASPRFAAPSDSMARPAEASLPNTAFSNYSGNPVAAPPGEQTPARMADSRSGDPAAGMPADGAGYGGSRYSPNTGSRFGGGNESAAPVSAPNGIPSSVQAYGQPAAQAFPAATQPMPAPAAPFTTPPTSPGLLQPSAPPVRRPDPIYRPGGTSSYRPSRVILADDASPAAASIRTASYEEPLGETVQQ